MKIIKSKYSFMITHDHLEACLLTLQPWLIGCIKGHQQSQMMTKNVISVKAVLKGTPPYCGRECKYVHKVYMK